MLPYEEFCRLKSEHTEPITSATFSPDGTLLATSSLDGKLCIWKWRSNKLLFRFLSKGPVAVLCCLWKPGCNDQVICGLEDGAIAEYSFRAFQGRAIVDGFHAHHYPVEKLAISGRYLASGAQQELRVWRDTKHGRMLESHLPRPSTDRNDDLIITSLNWVVNHSSEETLVATYMYHGIVFYNTSGWTISRIVKYASPLTDASISLDGKKIALSNACSGFEVYALCSDFTSAVCSMKPQGSNSQKFPLPVHFVHHNLAVLTGGYNNDTTLWLVADTTQHRRLPTIPRARTTCIAASFNLDEQSSSKDQFAIAIGYTSGASANGVVIFTIKDPGSTKRTSYSLLYSETVVSIRLLLRLIYYGVLFSSLFCLAIFALFPGYILSAISRYKGL